MVIVSDQINIELNREEVCRCLGYSDNRNPSRKILELIDEYLENAYNLIEPSYLHVVRDIEWVQDSCVLVGGPDDSHSHDVVFEGNVVSELLEQCHKVGVFVVTIGQYLEDTVFELTNKGHVLQAIVLDAIGSSAVEKVADFAQGIIRKTAQGEGCVISRRLSPGHCNWDVGQQKEVFKAVDGDAVGVCLTDQCLMVPQKSISSIVGISSSDGNVEEYNPCETCDKLECVGRR